MLETWRACCFVVTSWQHRGGCLGAAGGDGDTLATVPCQLFDFEAATDIDGAMPVNREQTVSPVTHGPVSFFGSHQITQMIDAAVLLAQLGCL